MRTKRKVNMRWNFRSLISPRRFFFFLLEEISNIWSDTILLQHYLFFFTVWLGWRWKDQPGRDERSSENSTGGETKEGGAGGDPKGAGC